MAGQQQKIKCGLLGCTGMVGQRFIQLLEGHPQFELAVLGASPRSAGQEYQKACQWRLSTPLPQQMSAMTVQLCKPEHFAACRIVFSGLDSDVAGEIELEFSAAGFAVFSNAKNHRMAADVPLVVPLVNADHLQMVQSQLKQHGGNGFIVTNANCSTTGLVVPLKAINDQFPISQLHVSTMQAISGAGYPGISALDIVGNVVPYISDEEHKIETEPLKILGALTGDKFINCNMLIDATCHRVPVVDGHTETVSIKFADASKKPSVEQVKQLLKEYKCHAQKLKIRSAPQQCIIVRDEVNRPQPALDLMAGGGYSVTVGRVRQGNYWDLTFTLLSHNTILGAAGSSIMNAELAIAMRLL